MPCGLAQCWTIFWSFFFFQPIISTHPGKLPQNKEIMLLKACVFNVKAYDFVLFFLQLCFGRWGLPFTEGPGQGPVHPHHRGERGWEDRWVASRKDDHPVSHTQLYIFKPQTSLAQTDTLRLLISMRHLFPVWTWKVLHLSEANGEENA